MLHVRVLHKRQLRMRVKDDEGSVCVRVYLIQDGGRARRGVIEKERETETLAFFTNNTCGPTPNFQQRICGSLKVAFAFLPLSTIFCVILQVAFVF